MLHPRKKSWRRNARRHGHAGHGTNAGRNGTGHGGRAPDTGPGAGEDPHPGATARASPPPPGGPQQPLFCSGATGGPAAARRRVAGGTGAPTGPAPARAGEQQHRFCGNNGGEWAGAGTPAKKGGAYARPLFQGFQITPCSAYRSAMYSTMAWSTGRSISTSARPRRSMPWARA